MLGATGWGRIQGHFTQIGQWQLAENANGRGTRRGCVHTQLGRLQYWGSAPPIRNGGTMDLNAVGTTAS